jgi:hypothetical protein
MSDRLSAYLSEYTRPLLDTFSFASRAAASPCPFDCIDSFTAFALRRAGALEVVCGGVRDGNGRRSKAKQSIREAGWMDGYTI